MALRTRQLLSLALLLSVAFVALAARQAEPPKTEAGSYAYPGHEYPSKPSYRSTEYAYSGDYSDGKGGKGSVCTNNCDVKCQFPPPTPPTPPPTCDCNTAATGTVECYGECVFPRKSTNCCGKGDPGNPDGQTCKPGYVCDGTTCVCPDQTKQTDCPDGCVDTQNDPKNCGDCGNVCADGEFCFGGSCGSCTTTCEPPKYVCDNVCLVPNTNANCGSSCSKCNPVGSPGDSTQCLCDSSGKCACVKCAKPGASGSFAECTTDPLASPQIPCCDGPNGDKYICVAGQGQSGNQCKKK